MWIVDVLKKVWNPDFYVCYYRVEGVEAGRFAALGKNAEQARRDAEHHLRRRFEGVVREECEFVLEEPSLYQRINAALRTA